MRFHWSGRTMLCAPEPGEGGAPAGGGTPPKKEEKPEPDGRTEGALQEDVARQGADIERLKVATGLDEVIEDDGGADDEGDDEGGVDDILAEGLVFGDDDDEDEKPSKKKGKAA